MPINFNTQAVQAFDVYRTGTLDANTNIQKADGALKTGGTGCGFFSAIFRGKSDKTANNAARTDFLLSLGRAYKIEGATVGEGGKATFSTAFMDKLEQLLGPAFNRSDYGIDAHGQVASGKPLTARRIKAVLTKAIVGGDMAFSAPCYQVKLDAVFADIKARAGEKGMERVRAKFEHVQHALDFLKDELPTLFSDNIYYSSDADEDAEDDARFSCYVKQTGPDGNSKQVLVTSKETVFGYLREKCDLLLHEENFPAKPTDENFADMARTYVANVLELYVKTAVDLYLTTKDTDQFKAFTGVLTENAFCMEKKTSNLQEFKLDNHIGTEDMEVAGKNQVPPADHDETVELQECIAREILQVEKHKPGQELTWDKDYLPVLEQHLVGLNRPQGGVLKPVTLADIQALRGDVAEAIYFDRDAL